MSLGNAAPIATFAMWKTLPSVASYVRTKKKIPLRSAVQILLDMPVGQVRGRAIVRRIADHGMGIQIIAMDPGDRARLLQQLRELPPST